ncbi:hypothetical protein, variant 1 [Exophiala mesophila]|uniref:LisH domain-containing protein n=1 Tax=Exophiala mesophila TaxID=212818 RepID=A0A0D1YC05_EXOME|nr:hypothetical protein, variant 1 [Exophiala mesophila]KIV98226.1 hypothetical protein, variant 1 [Exophiala mesophila]
METDNSSTFSAKPPPLSSDQLNYLIWRYLQESGYGEAAVKLQRDWKVDAETLSFAKQIKGHALVSLVQKGLRYHYLSLTIDENGRPSKQLNPSMFFFGPEADNPRREAPDDSAPQAASPDNATTATRKLVRDTPNGQSDPNIAQPSTKKGRKPAAASDRNGSTGRKSTAANRSASTPGVDHDVANGHPPSLAEVRSPSATEPGLDENGVQVNGVKHDDRMDIDDDLSTAEHPINAPSIESISLPINTLTTGESIGIQVVPAKVANLGPFTTILQADVHPSAGGPKSITRVAWRPRLGDVVTAMGDDFCGHWKLPERLSQNQAPPVFQSVVEPAAMRCISAVAWEPNGDIFALATYSEQSGQLHLYDGQELTLLEALPASQRAIISLRWHARGLRLLGIAPYDNNVEGARHQPGSSILLWDLSKSPNFAGPSSISVPEILVDMDSASHGDQGIVCAAGQTSVYLYHVFSELEKSRHWHSDPAQNHQWTIVRCAWYGNEVLLVTASADSAALWLPMKDAMKLDAHEGNITGLELRPRPYGSAFWKQEFATSSMDGTIKVWQYDQMTNSIISLCKLVIGPASPVMQLAYSPDAFCLAGASYDAIRIWNAEHGHNHMATWRGEPETWAGSRLKDDDTMSIGGMSNMNGDAQQISTDHSLVWDVESRRLAFGLGSQVAIIEFQR